MLARTQYTARFKHSKIMIMAIHVEPDSRTLSSTVTWESHFVRKSVFRDLRPEPETGLDAHAGLCTAILQTTLSHVHHASLNFSFIFKF